MRSSCATCCWRYCRRRSGGGRGGGGDAAVAVEVAGLAMAASGASGTLGGALAQTGVPRAAESCQPAAHGENLGHHGSSLVPPGGGAGGRARDSGTAAASAAAALVAQPQRPPVHIIPSPMLRGFGYSVSSALRLYCLRPASSAPSFLLPFSPRTTPPPGRCLRRNHVSPPYSLEVSASPVATFPNQLGHFAAVLSALPCDNVLLLGGSYGGSHKPKRRVPWSLEKQMGSEHGQWMTFIRVRGIELGEGSPFV